MMEASLFLVFCNMQMQAPATPPILRRYHVMTPPSHACFSGFALVVALLLMSFIFLLLISFSVMVQIEVQSSAQNKNLSVARENALLGLQIALAQLQESAGGDQRVTARADIFEEKIAVDRTRCYWTGVWNVENGDKPQVDNATWLVSGVNGAVNLANPLTGNNLVRVLGEGSASVDQLTAPGGVWRKGFMFPLSM